ncbi:nucleotidyltransferase family protein [Aestuariibacter sp. GS-14]|uniref:nucleotidyltransferase family protein n=1 Tax=Aestuariibacter sp. GS-14 TaxID=2590670 RepID=UPI00112C9D1F|nr:nucleotidyltransferase family protein [Aestuariibacter sp. GS-14]TPV53849.1 nucleotidyltransferase family protein [Aestuariibacter sp. GS-14]
MKLAINETYYFYHQCLRKELTNFERKQLIELVLKYPHLQRFAALLPIQSTTDLPITETQKAKFNAIKMAIIATNLKQQAFIRSIAREFELHSITVVLLKSSALNGYLYPNQRCRGNSDIDMLIRSNEKDKLEQILQKVAYLHNKSDSQPFDGLYEQSWISKQDPTLFIDVHTDLTNPKLFSICNADIFALSREHPQFNTPAIRVMGPEHNFIHAALHIFGDGYLPHHSLLDASSLLNKLKMSSRGLEQICKAWGCQLITHLLITELEDTKLTIKSFNQPISASLRIKIGRYLLSKNYPVKSLRRKLQQALLQIILVDSFKRTIATQMQYMRLKLFR